MNTTLRIEEKTIVKTTIEEFDRYVDWDDIKGSVESDDDWDAPWEHCDGWEHDVEESSYHDHDNRPDSHTYFNRRSGDGYIIVSDEDVVKWGCVGASGCSKQVRFEAIAAAKRKATEQLVEWFEDGWYVYCAVARYGDYIEALGGIYDDSWGEYASECVKGCRHNLADEMEKDGYIIVGRPSTKVYGKIEAFKDRMKRNMDC